jgi:hypothetical protein
MLSSKPFKFENWRMLLASVFDNLAKCGVQIASNEAYCSVKLIDDKPYLFKGNGANFALVSVQASADSCPYVALQLSNAAHSVAPFNETFHVLVHSGMSFAIQQGTISHG